MSHAERCPVCYGTGKYTPPQDPNSTAVSTPQTCHGCGGKGWVEVDSNQPNSIPYFPYYPTCPYYPTYP